jgi:hypothetical protein
LVVAAVPYFVIAHLFHIPLAELEVQVVVEEDTTVVVVVRLE